MTHQNANFRAFVDAVEAVEAIRREADDESSSFPMWEASAAVVVAAAAEVKAYLSDITKTE